MKTQIDLFGAPVGSMTAPREDLRQLLCPRPSDGHKQQLAQSQAPSGATAIVIPATGAQLAQNRRRLAQSQKTLLDERNRLLQELQEANGETDRTWQVYRPLKAEFDHCDSLMREWADARRQGKLFRYDAWMSGLDNRMNAGHAAHPFKVKWQQADEWRKRVVEELRNINEALEK